MKSSVHKLTRVVTIVLGVLILFSILFYAGTYHPSAVEEEHFISGEDAPTLLPGQKIKVLNWNIQFMAGNTNNHYFYSGGNDPWPTQETIDQTIKEVARVIIAENPDIVLLQEVDDGSVRTHHEDQLAKLLQQLPKEYSNHASSFYWKTAFVPHSAIMGSMGMKLSTISKYKIKGATRYALAPIANQSFLTQQLSIKRALLEVRLPIEGKKALRVLNGHLSAFAQGSNTMELQIAQVDQLLEEMEKNGDYGLIGGDFNLIPPGKAFDRLSEETQKYYNSQGTEMQLLYDKYQPIPTYEEVNGDDYQKWFTAMSTKDKEKIPNKTIDYLIFTKFFEVGEHYVRNDDTLLISDHLPLISWVTIPE